jgi:hypothetical protein
MMIIICNILTVTTSKKWLPGLIRFDRVIPARSPMGQIALHRSVVHNTKDGGVCAVAPVDEHTGLNAIWCSFITAGDLCNSSPPVTSLWLTIKVKNITTAVIRLSRMRKVISQFESDRAWDPVSLSRFLIYFLIRRYKVSETASLNKLRSIISESTACCSHSKCFPELVALLLALHYIHPGLNLTRPNGIYAYHLLFRSVTLHFFHGFHVILAVNSDSFLKHR